MIPSTLRILGSILGRSVSTMEPSVIHDPFPTMTGRLEGSGEESEALLAERAALLARAHTTTTTTTSTTTTTTTTTPSSTTTRAALPPRFAGAAAGPSCSNILASIIPGAPVATSYSVPIIRDLLAGPNGRSPMQWWVDMCGPELLTFALPKFGTDPAYIRPLTIMLTNLNVHVGSEAEFARVVGISDAVAQHWDVLAGWIIENHQQHWRADRVLLPSAAESAASLGLRIGFTARLPLFIPSLFAGSDLLANVALAHAVYRHVINQPRMASPYISVARSAAFEESVDALVGDVRSLYGGLSVDSTRFKNEHGIGEGVVRDWFSEVASQIYSPDHALFVRRADEEPPYTKLCQLAIHKAGFRRLYQAVGRFMALSLISANPVGVTFPVMFYAKLLGKRVTLDDIAEDEPAVHGPLSQLMRYTREQFDELAEAGLDIELPIRGVDVPVTFDNREAVIGEKINSLMDEDDVDIHFAAFRAGFDQLIPINIIAPIITSQQMKAILLGYPVMNVDDLIANVQLGGGFSHNSSQIHYLWNVLRSYDDVKKSRFLRFVTGSTQVPIGGFGSLSRKFKVTRSFDPVGELPIAVTCYNILKLPFYCNEDALREQLDIALGHV